MSCANEENADACALGRPADPSAPFRAHSVNASAQALNTDGNPFSADREVEDTAGKRPQISGSADRRPFHGFRLHFLVDNPRNT